MAAIRPCPARPAFASVALGLALVLGGCAALEAPRRIPPPAQKPAPSAKPTPIPTRALSIAAECSFRDETGYQGAMKLDVADARVRTFDARVDIPGRGICRFDLRRFRQTAMLPNVTLSALGSACVVRMWEQGRRVTVAFHRCEDMCSGDAYSYLWPILANAQTGGCG